MFHVKFHSVLSYIGAQLVKLKTERNVFSQLERNLRMTISLFMGEFNRDLLNFEGCQITEDFINILISHNFSYSAAH